MSHPGPIARNRSHQPDRAEGGDVGRLELGVSGRDVEEHRGRGARCPPPLDDHHRAGAADRLTQRRDGRRRWLERRRSISRIAASDRDAREPASASSRSSVGDGDVGAVEVAGDAAASIAVEIVLRREQDVRVQQGDAAQAPARTPDSGHGAPAPPRDRGRWRVINENQVEASSYGAFRPVRQAPLVHHARRPVRTGPSGRRPPPAAASLPRVARRPRRGTR